MKYARGMRKLAIAAVLGGLVAALSGCVVVVSTDPTVSAFQFQSNWRRTADSAFVFCTNRTTQISYSFKAADGVVSAIEERYVGFASGNTLIQNRALNELTRDGDRLVFESAALPFGNNGVPQSVGGGVIQQAIIITPVTPPTSNNGRTTLTVRVTNTSGTVFTGSYAFDTYANCP